MNNIIFPTSDNEAAHRKIKLLMKQKRQLCIRLDDVLNAWISGKGFTGLSYRLNNDSMQWIINYLSTGEYEDYGVFPSRLQHIAEDFQIKTLESLIDNKCNVARIPFLRETQAYIKLRGLFRYGKMFFSIRRTDDFDEYLIRKGI